MLTMYKWGSPALKQIWQKLYADNPYLFPYSSWEYNEQIYKYMRVKPSSMFQKNFFGIGPNFGVGLLHECGWT